MELAVPMVMPNWLVRDLMTPVVAVLSVGDTLATAREQLERAHIRHLPVVDGANRLVGLVTQRSVVAAWLSHGHPDHERPGAVASEVPVEMVMERDVLTVDENTTAAHAAELLEDHKFGCLPVVDAEGRLLGILTEADFVRLARSFFEWEERQHAPV
jgi:CBS domain-containing membrane protein